MRTGTDLQISLLRLATAGSVDDGKSTLVGRLLYDTKSVLADQLQAVERASRDRGLEEADLALLTDGLRAEREQGITIDVAYRYFATPRRRFILADTPGHVQYTRNMVTGASTAQLTVLLADARTGVVEQTRRHAAIAALLRVPHVVLAVNKMDLAGYRESAFAAIADEFTAFATGLGMRNVTAIPISALRGDNVVDPSQCMDWYAGPTLLEHMERIPAASDSSQQSARLPIQCVIRPRTQEHRDYRGYAGQMTSGRFDVGEDVVVLPTGLRSRITAIDVLGTPSPSATVGQSVTLLLADDIDVARGDLIAPASQAPTVTRDIAATVCHLSERPLRAGDRVLVKHTTRTVKGIVTELTERLDTSTLTARPSPDELHANDIGRIRIRTATPLAVDAYSADRATGALLLIDALDGETLTAGMVGDGPAAFTSADASGAADAADLDNMPGV